MWSVTCLNCLTCPFLSPEATETTFDKLGLLTYIGFLSCQSFLFSSVLHPFIFYTTPDPHSSPTEATTTLNFRYAMAKNVSSSGRAKKAAIKTLARPTADKFRVGAARLDLMNSTAPGRKVPAIIYLSSDSEESVTDVNELPEARPKSKAAT
jgi:hypothetical protein